MESQRVQFIVIKFRVYVLQHDAKWYFAASQAVFSSSPAALSCPSRKMKLFLA